METMISVTELSHTFFKGKGEQLNRVNVLSDINLTVRSGELVAIMGKSGSGKSTLLNILSGYLTPTEGKICLNSTDVTDFDEGQWADFRLEHMGFIFQSYQLIPSMTVFNNVQLPLTVKGISPAKRIDLVEKTLTRVNLLEHKSFYPSELSGGQQQRVSVARALINDPPILLADEPTGSLDSQNELQLLDLIIKLNQDFNITILLVTHDEEVAKIADRKITIRDGSILELESESR